MYVVLDGLNIYTYVGGNPVSYTDPSGLWPMYGCWTGSNWSSCSSGPDILANPQKPVDAIDECAMHTIIVMPRPHLRHIHVVLLNYLLSAAVIRN